MQSLNLVWEKALEYLEESMHSMSYKAFIKDLKPVLLKDGAFCFEVSSPHHKDIMSQKYSTDISEALNLAYADIYGAGVSDIFAEFLTPNELKGMLAQKSSVPKVSEIKRDTRTIRLNPDYTFENFVVGESNRMANAAAHAVAKEPGNSYNPLFLYGGVGLGKTHLMHAIGNEILSNNPDADVMYVTSETFTNDLIHMIALTNSNANTDVREQFRNKYRTVDVLMIDDIQFIAGKNTTQEEFFHTFNDLHELKKQIVITSDRPPEEIDKLAERMRSRFTWGMVDKITAPDYETRVAILIKKAEQKYVTGMPQIDNEVFHYIASRENINIRTLEGALQRLLMYAQLYKDALNIDRIDINVGMQALEDFFPPSKNREITPKVVADAICKYYKINEKDIISAKKSRDIAFPRQIAMYLIRTLTGLSLSKIGDFFGKDHTTIMHAEKQIKKLIDENSDFKNEINEIIVKITG